MTMDTSFNDISAGLGADTGTGGNTAPTAQNAPPTTTAPRDAEPLPGEQDKPDPETEKLLDAWEKGESSTTSQQSQQNDPYQGLDPNHPVVRQLMQQSEEHNYQIAEAAAARQLMQQGIPQQMIPDFIEFFRGVRQMKQERDQLQNFVSNLDNSKFVKEAKANELSRKFGRYGVNAKDLMTANPGSAAEMENLAKALAVQNRRSTVGTRSSKQQDVFEDGRGGGARSNDVFDFEKPGLDLIYGGLKG